MRGRDPQFISERGLHSKRETIDQHNGGLSNTQRHTRCSLHYGRSLVNHVCHAQVLNYGSHIVCARAHVPNTGEGRRPWGLDSMCREDPKSGLGLLRDALQRAGTTRRRTPRT